MPFLPSMASTATRMRSCGVIWIRTPTPTNSRLSVARYEAEAPFNWIRSFPRRPSTSSVHSGTVHANDALSGLIRLESLVAEATSAPQQTLIAEAVDLVVFVDQEPELKAGRKVREVALVTGYSGWPVSSRIRVNRKRRTI